MGREGVEPSQPYGRWVLSTYRIAHPQVAHICIKRLFSGIFPRILWVVRHIKNKGVCQMSEKIETQRTLQISIVDDYLLMWMEAFLIDRQTSGVAEGTPDFYRIKLKMFADYCDAQTVKNISQITPTLIRQYFLFLEGAGHNPGGRHAAFRTMRVFLYWYEDEVEPKDWSNPIHRVKAPKVPLEPIEPVSIETVTKMIKACDRDTFTGDRDIAVFLCLLDTGARASEFLNIDLVDTNQVSGDILIRQGKGYKPRTVYIGRQSRKALRKYLKHRSDNNPALWVTHPRFDSERIKYDGLRERSFVDDPKKLI